MEIDKVYNEDNTVTLQRMDDNFLDLTITSPPYNVDLGNNKYNKKAYDEHNDNMAHDQYIGWLQCIFAMIYQKTKLGGRCAINIGDGKNGSIPTHSDVIQMMCSIGWLPMTTIIWNKNTTSNRTAWGSWMSPSCPSFPRAFEYILVFSRHQLKLAHHGTTDLTKDEFIKWSLGGWTMACENPKKVNHPAPFPIELPTRLMKMLSWTDAIVYDPFAGSGTTAVACVKNNRHYILSEISEDYCQTAIQRISAMSEQ